MARKPSAADSAARIYDVPTYFADQPAAVMLGANICKITLGSADLDDNPYPRPVVTIAMPTVALLQMINDLKKQLSAPKFKRFAVSTLEADAKKIASGETVSRADQMLEIGTIPPAAKKAGPKTH